MATTMVHRGPDDEGYYVQEAVGLGMRRLRIIDLEGGAQPMANEDQSIWVIFNGEIYNHNELRVDLEARGHQFRTRSDTEAIVHAYEEFGLECVKQFNGMFAFAVWDRRSNRLMLARDRIGIKPLYYRINKNGIVFGSELKPILVEQGEAPEIDFEALDAYLTLEYIPAPLSIVAGVRKLPAGHLLVIERGQSRVHCYWDIPQDTMTASENDIADHLRGLLQKSVKRRLLSDVPLGVLLSGGVDSSTIATLMSSITRDRIKTFSIGFDDPSYNELEFARTVARHVNADHHELIIRPNAVQLAERLLTFLDEPLGDVSVFPVFLVSQMAREHVTVALAGDGGDELFAGYDHYLADKVATHYGRLPAFLHGHVIAPLLRAYPPSNRKKGLVNRLKRFADGLRYPPELAHARWMIYMGPAEKQALFTEELESQRPRSDVHAHVTQYLHRNGSAGRLEDQLYADLKTYLVDDLLVKVDRMSMAVSLEARVPFLDHEVVEFAARIPAALKLRGFTRKHILRKAVGHLLPPAILTRGKEGFSIPMKNWLRGELKPMMLDLLSADRLRRQGWFQGAYVEHLISDHLQGRANHSHRLWPLMVFQLWCDRYLTGTWEYQPGGEYAPARPAQDLVSPPVGTSR
jgi:asparagine synthase (glutamine-hydrolysing)